ncbi:MAG: amino acid permease [Candidatus Marsarchaeota archaeon]|nr:amino acid permease [Candidatus Marsarchaeota archaeon]
MYELKRAITLTDAIMINLGAIIGAGIFVIIGIAIGAAGPAIIISIIISAIVAIFTGLSFSEIASHVAKEGGSYEYARVALMPSAGVMAGLAWTFGNIIAIAAVSLSLGSYVNILTHASIPLPYFAIISILAFMLINIFGVKNSAKTITWLVAINILILIIFVIVGMFYFKPSNFAYMLPYGTSGMLTGAALIFFAFTGFSRVTTISDEVVDPEKTIPKAIIISIIISTVLYIAVAIVALGLVPYSSLAASSAPLSTAIASIHNNVLDLIIAIGGIAATAGVMLTGILGTSRVFYAMGRDLELPKALSRLDRFSTPINSIVLSSLLGIVFILLVSFGNIVEASNASILVSYLIINIAAFNLWLKLQKGASGDAGSAPMPLRKKKHFGAIPILGIASILLILAYIKLYGLAISFGIIAASSIYYAIRHSLYKEMFSRISIRIPKRSKVRTFGKSRPA